MSSTHTPARPTQLSLFTSPAVPERFLLDEATKRRGLRHIAEIKARLEARFPGSAGGPAAPLGRVGLGARSEHVHGRAA